MGGDWQLLGVVETIFGSLCVMASVFCFFSLSFQSFVLSHLVIAPVRMIPTYPSPKSTLALASHLGQNVSLEEG